MQFTLNKWNSWEQHYTTSSCGLLFSIHQHNLAQVLDAGRRITVPVPVICQPWLSLRGEMLGATLLLL